jgi:hypothetical protein
MRSWLFILALVAGCKADPKAARNDPAIAALRLERASPAFPSQVVLHERDGKGKLAYLGVDLEPKSPGPGDLVDLTHYFQVLEPMTGEWDVFVHGETADGQRIFVGRWAARSLGTVLGHVGAVSYLRGLSRSRREARVYDS